MKKNPFTEIICFSASDQKVQEASRTTSIPNLENYATQIATIQSQDLPYSASSQNSRHLTKPYSSFLFTINFNSSPVSKQKLPLHKSTSTYQTNPTTTIHTKHNLKMDPNLQSLLKWSVENTPTTTTTNPSADSSTPSSRPINPDALNALFGGPSDAELMNLSMSAILSTDPQITLEDKLTAFDNFEQLIENLDNANNLEPLSLWTPLLSCLTSPEPEIRKMAAWCVGTAVQNNLKSQEKLVAAGEAGIPELVKVARREGEEEGVRRKACYALSSACRNFQPAMDLLTGSMGKEKVDAGDMDEVDVLIGGLRDGVKATVTA